MATQSLFRTSSIEGPISRPRVAFKLHLHRNIRTDLLVTRLLLVAGFLIPALMAWGVLPASLLLIFIAIALIMAGGVGWLIRWGEIV